MGPGNHRFAVRCFQACYYNMYFDRTRTHTHCNCFPVGHCHVGVPCQNLWLGLRAGNAGTYVFRSPERRAVPVKATKMGTIGFGIQLCENKGHPLAVLVVANSSESQSSAGAASGWVRPTRMEYTIDEFTCHMPMHQHHVFDPGHTDWLAFSGSNRIKAFNFRVR